MPPVLTLFAIAALYLVAALYTAWRLVRDRRSLLAGRWTDGDRQLAGQAGFLLLTPPTVWLHEWGHAAVMRLFGVTDPQIHFFLYWGYVSSRHPFTPPQDFWVALAGPLVSWLVGWLLLAVALLWPMRAALALALASCALANLALVLIFYPGWSLVGGWGDFVEIYGSGYPLATIAVGAVHALSLLGFGWLTSRLWMRGFLAYPCPRPWRRQWMVVEPPAGPKRGGA